MLTADEQKEAAELGWKLCDVYDLAKQRWILTVMPAGPSIQSVRDVQLAFIEQARNRIAVASKALKLIVSSNVSRRPA